jgi:hypothetical protein
MGAMMLLRFLIAGLLCVTGPAFAAEESWSSCQADADCVVVGSVCPNFYWAINRAYIFENAARNAAERGNLDCAVSFQSRPERATCQAGQCHIPPNKAMSAQTETNP